MAFGTRTMQCMCFLVGLLGLVIKVNGCSDVMLSNTTVFDAVVSGRNYDFFAQMVLTLGLTFMPAGTPVTYTPLLGCNSPQGLSTQQMTSKYGYGCVAAGRPEFIVAIKALCRDWDMKVWPGECTEGINTAGLSVGALTEQSQPMAPNATNLVGQKPGLYFNDIPAFLLATFGSVAEIAEKSTPQNYRIVNNEVIYAELFKASKIAATRIDHFSLHDKLGNSGVVEFSLDSTGAYTWQVIMNPLGVLTNSPGLPTHLAYYNEFKNNQTAQYGINGVVMTPGFCGVGWNITSYANNNCNSMGRFTALAMFKEAIAISKFPDPTYLESPASNPLPSHQALILTARLLDSVKIPGHWPMLEPVGPAPNSNQILGPEEMTIIQHLKDHRALRWYLKTAANEQWVMYDLKRIFSKTAGIKQPVYKRVGEEAGPTRRWATDKTAGIA